MRELENAEIEMSAMMLGKQIGHGQHRKVYINNLDTNTVIKVEQNAGEFSNIKEWEIYAALNDGSGAREFLAPCRFISPCGTILIQDRTWPIMVEDLPKKIPEFINGDLKSLNWGWLGRWKKRRPVCHDYGNNYVFMGSLKLVKADWSRG